MDIKHYNTDHSEKFLSKVLLFLIKLFLLEKTAVLKFV